MNTRVCFLVDVVSPSRTAAPFWGQISDNVSGLFPKRDCSTSRGKARPDIVGSIARYPRHSMRWCVSGGLQNEQHHGAFPPVLYVHGNNNPLPLKTPRGGIFSKNMYAPQGRSQRIYARYVCIPGMLFVMIRRTMRVWMVRVGPRTVPDQVVFVSSTFASSILYNISGRFRRNQVCNLRTTCMTSLVFWLKGTAHRHAFNLSPNNYLHT